MRHNILLAALFAITLMTIGFAPTAVAEPSKPWICNGDLHHHGATGGPYCHGTLVHTDGTVICEGTYDYSEDTCSPCIYGHPEPHDPVMAHQHGCSLTLGAVNDALGGGSGGTPLPEDPVIVSHCYAADEHTICQFTNGGELRAPVGVPHPFAGSDPNCGTSARAGNIYVVVLISLDGNADAGLWAEKNDRPGLQCDDHDSDARLI